MVQSFKVGDLNQLIKESSNEFKAKLGAGVESDDKKNNGKAYKDAEKRAKDYDGGLKKELGEEDYQYEKEDINGTLLDYQFDNAPDENYKKKAKALAQGYNSTDEKNNGIEKSGNFKGNDKIYNGFKKSYEKRADAVKTNKASGLAARTLDKKTFDKESVYETKIKTAHFKKTEFLSEEHMKTRVPDDFKKQGMKFKMVDKNGCTYLCEWDSGNCFVLEYDNKKGFDEAFSKIKKLMEYKQATERSTNTQRLQEDTKFSEILGKVRKLQ